MTSMSHCPYCGNDTIHCQGLCVRCEQMRIDEQRKIQLLASYKDLPLEARVERLEELIYKLAQERYSIRAY